MQVEGGMKIASFKDPNGVLIELVEHLNNEKLKIF
jgi:hypothetical protein